MEDPKIDEINTFCREKGLTVINIDPKKRTRASGRVEIDYTVKFTCFCGKEETKTYDNLKRTGCCRFCKTLQNPRTTDEFIRTKMVEFGHELIAINRIQLPKPKLMVTFNCKYCKDTAKNQATRLWSSVVDGNGSSCDDCVMMRQKTSSKATMDVRGDEIRAQQKRTNLERYGSENPFGSAEIQAKIKATNLEKYGVEHSMQNAEVRAKAKATNIERYGYDNPMQNPEVKEQIKNSSLEKYKYEYPTQNPLIKAKIAATNMERLGVKYPQQNAEVRAKTRASNMENYGVEYVIQNPDVYAKMEATNIERYGVANVSQNPEIRAKVVATNMEKLGVEYPQQSAEVRAKSEATYIERYGVSNPLKSSEIREKAMVTYFEKHGYAYPMQNPEVKEKIAQTMIERYGVRHGMHHPEIYARVVKNAFKLKEYVMPSGRIIHCQGYEPFAYDILLQNYSEEEILCEVDIIARLPAFWYEHNGVKRRYYPDIFIESTCTIIEVKSEWTYSCKTDIVMIKRQAVIDAGFECEIWIINEHGKLIRTI